MRKILLFILLSIFCFACDDDVDLTLPSEVNLDFLTAPQEALNGRLSVERLEIQLRKIEIIGRRNAGSDVNLERNFNSDGAFDALNNPHSSLSFDIPQGSYQNLNFNLVFERDDEEDDDIAEDIEEWLEDKEDGDDEDDDEEDGDGEEDRTAIVQLDDDDLAEDLGEIVEDYLEDVKPALLFTATVVRNNVRFKVVMPINESFLYNIPVLNADEGREITLVTNTTTNLEVVFNPEYWFAISSFESLNNADKGKLSNGETVVFLHKQINPNLFSLIINRIEESTFIRVK